MHNLSSYLELIDSLLVHIKQQYPSNSWLQTDKESHAFYKTINTQRTTQKNIVSPLDSKKSVEKATGFLTNPTPFSPQKKSIVAEEVNANKLEPYQEKKLNRVPVLKSLEVDFSDLWKFFKEKLPAISLSESIPDDAEGKRIANQYKGPFIEVLLFSCNKEKEKIFASNLQFAISHCLAPAKLLFLDEVETWQKFLDNQSLQLIITDQICLKESPELSNRYQEKSIPFLLLSDLSLYVQQPLLKATLWRELCLRLKKKAAIPANC